MNHVVLIGNLSRDAEQKHTPNGSSVTRFAIATNRRYKQGDEWKDEVNFTNCVLWGQENLAPYLQKGKQVYAAGRLQTRSYDDKDGKKVYATEVVCEEVILLGGAQQSPDPAPKASGTSYEKNQRDFAKFTGAKNEDPFGGLGVADADVPF